MPVRSRTSNTNSAVAGSVAAGAGPLVGGGGGPDPLPPVPPTAHLHPAAVAAAAAAAAAAHQHPHHHMNPLSGHHHGARDAPRAQRPLLLLALWDSLLQVRRFPRFSPPPQPPELLGGCFFI